jgi:hypothetical protein
MNSSDPQTLIIAAIVLVAVIAGAWLITREQRRKQSRHLQQRFGPEYGRMLTEHGNREKAETELRAREKRVERLKIVPLTTADAAKFSNDWGVLQSRFIDNPKGVVIEADQLVRDLMVRRGYPMGDFEHRAADISVHHPTVVDTYRSAQAIAVRDQRGEATTEELRKAVVYYRALFDELLEVRGTQKVAAPERETAVHS